jgi:capsular exopolysaccharide synthesis family protein
LDAFDEVTSSAGTIQMSDDKLLPPSARGSGGVPAVPGEVHAGSPAPYGGDAYYPALEEESGIDPKRYLYALVRYKWLLLLAVVLGAAGAAVGWSYGEVRYLARGTLWIEVERRLSTGDVAPIRQSGLLAENAWMQLLRSYAVLDSVVIAQRLYVNGPVEHTEAFRSLVVTPSVRAGAYELRVSPDGQEYALATRVGARAEALVEQGRLGDPIGQEAGFVWTPPALSFAPAAVVPFTITTPREAANQLLVELGTRMDGTGNFLSVELGGTRPERITATVNAVMDRHIEVAAELKRGQLDEISRILGEQLRYTNAELADAERELEEWRITTISLPSDRSAPIAAGLQITRDPVFTSFFEMRVEVEQLRRDRARLQTALDSFRDSGEVRIEALEIIPSAARSSELRRIMDELVTMRSQLRALRDRYRDDYPLVQDLLLQLRSIESGAIPQVVEGILAELDRAEGDLQAQIDRLSTELEAIPPRTIEERRLERRVQITEALYNELRGRVETARLAAASSIPDVRILDRAATPQSPAEDTRLFLASIIFFGFLGTAVGGAILLDRLDARFRYATDVSREMGLDILGSIPRIQSGKNKRGILNAAAALEAFRELRIHLGFAHGAAGPITLAISSPAAGEGKSLISSNLAVAFAEVGRRTLLIDGDTRRGDAHKLLGREQSPGLIDYLKERSGQEVIQSTEHANLDFIGCGSRGVSTPELLASTRMAHLMGTLKRSYEVIIVDTPPLAAGGDAMILSTLTGNLAIVIRPGATERQLAQVKLEQISRLPIRILGAILNDVDPTDGYHYYYSSYLPGYEPVPEEGEEAGATLISEGRGQAS